MSRSTILLLTSLFVLFFSPINTSKLILLEKTGNETDIQSEEGGYSIVPVNNRRFMVFNLPKKQVTKLLSKAELFCIQNIFNGNIATSFIKFRKY